MFLICTEYLISLLDEHIATVNNRYIRNGYVSSLL